MFAPRLPKPSESLGETANAIADLKVGELALPFMANEDENYKRVLMALRVAFWTGFWQECSMMEGQTERQFGVAKRCLADATLRVGPEAIETAERRGKYATRDFAGQNWRGASYQQIPAGS